MRTFDYLSLPRALSEGRIADLSATLYQDKGKLDLLEQLHPEELSGLTAQAHLDSVAASLQIEGLSISAEKLREQVRREGEDYPLQPPVSYFEGLSDVEAQAFGYSRALQAIERQPGQLSLSSGTAVRIYETLFAGRLLGSKSRYRKSDYTYVPIDGHAQAVPVSPVPAFETPLVFGGACDSLAEAFDAERGNPMALVAVFTVDMLCIRPFETGNGRIARLYATLLMEKAGFDVFRYMSVDRLIAQDAPGYYDALNSCVEGWDKGRADYRPFAEYWFKTVHRAYSRLFDVMDARLAAPGGKGERVRMFVTRAQEPVSKRDIMQAHPDISLATVEAELGKLVKEGLVRKLGKGRATAYIGVSDSAGGPDVPK